MLHSGPELGSTRYRQAAERIWDAYFSAYNGQELQGKLVIAISGRAGGGKSSLAYHLCKLFMERTARQASYPEQRSGERKTAKHLYADNLYRDNYEGLDPVGRAARRALRGFQGIGPDEYAWPEIQAIVDAFKRGARCRMPCIDLLDQRIDWLETDLAGCEVLVIEGLYAIDRTPADFKFFVEGETHPNEDPRNQEQISEERRRIMEAENRAIDEMVQRRLAQRDLILLKDWTLHDERG